MTLLAVERVGKRFGGVTALQDVSLRVPSGKATRRMGDE